MTDILETIVAQKRLEVAAAMEHLPERELHRIVEQQLAEGVPRRSLATALSTSATGIVAEFKRRSPSKGWLKEDGRPDVIPPAYERAGAAALSILTDEPFFGGCQAFIQTARPLVRIPILRKDFIIDEYQLFEARRIGADAVLLIAACLPLPQCRALVSLAHELNLEVLLELHAKKELIYGELEADCFGINNRHLGTFVTDVQNSFRLADRLPADRPLVSESGISSPATIRQLRAVGYRGFLIGETFMKTPDPGAALEQLIKEL